MEHLDAARLRAEQERMLASPRRRASLSARALFAVMDLLYGKDRTLPKFRVLELMARVPYQAWENVAYVAMTHTSREHGFARRLFDKVRVSRFADFEDHAEHEYAHLVAEHPEWEDVAYDGSFTGDYGSYDSLADLFRQIGYDQRLHKLESEGRMASPRFA